MTPEEFNAALASLRLTQAHLSRILKVDKGTPNKWANGGARVPTSVALLLAAWRAHPELLDGL